MVAIAQQKAASRAAATPAIIAGGLNALRRSAWPAHASSNVLLIGYEVLVFALRVQLPAVAVRIVKPQAQASRSESHWSDFVAGILDENAIFAKLGEGELQSRNISGVKRQMREYCRIGTSAHQREHDGIVAQ